MLNIVAIAEMIMHIINVAKYTASESFNENVIGYRNISLKSREFLNKVLHNRGVLNNMYVLTVIGINTGNCQNN